MGVSFLMHYAINVCDLLTLSRHDTILHMVIAPHVDRNHVVEAELDQIAGIGDAAVLTCSEEQAAALVAVVRRKYKVHQFRFYQSASGNGGWKRV